MKIASVGGGSPLAMALAQKPPWAGGLPPGTYPFNDGHGLRFRRDLLDRTPGKPRGWDVTTDFQPNQPPPAPRRSRT